MARFPCLLVVLVAFVLLYLVESSVGSGCHSAGLCCSGRDPSCVVHRHGHAPACYCDHDCMRVGDCCPDFQEACGVRDCLVSPWEEWSACSTDCGPGTQQRSREIQQPAANGGRLCPPLVQERGCQGEKCPKPNHVSAREAALLLPYVFSPMRRINATNDIRNNLRLRYPKDPAKENSKDYCVEFKVVKATKACGELEHYGALQQGARVCVRCETEAQRRHMDFRCPGEGEPNLKSRWASLRQPNCHGKWLRMSDISREQCPCSDSGPEFIFV